MISHAQQRGFPHVLYVVEEDTGMWLVYILYPDCSDLFCFVVDNLEAIQACLDAVSGFYSGK